MIFVVVGWVEWSQLFSNKWEIFSCLCWWCCWIYSNAKNRNQTLQRTKNEVKVLWAIFMRKQSMKLCCKCTTNSNDRNKLKLKPLQFKSMRYYLSKTCRNFENLKLTFRKFKTKISRKLFQLSCNVVSVYLLIYLSDLL